MSTRRVSEAEEITEVCSVLSNEKRVQLLRYVNEREPITLKEVHEGFSTEIGLSHRETTYKYLEDLVDASLLSKETITEPDRVKYSSEVKDIHIFL
jgi:Fe2+ or Zn2+ uptake regulation protein